MYYYNFCLLINFKSCVLRYTDFKIKETKKQLAEMQQNKKWMSDSRSGWKIRHLLRQFDGMVINYFNMFLSRLYLNLLFSFRIFTYLENLSCGYLKYEEFTKCVNFNFIFLSST